MPNGAWFPHRLPLFVSLTVSFPGTDTISFHLNNTVDLFLSRGTDFA